MSSQYHDPLDGTYQFLINSDWLPGWFSAEELSCVKLRCTGTHYDPKNITILRGLSGVSEVINEHLKLSREVGVFHVFMMEYTVDLSVPGCAICKRCAFQHGD